MALDAVIGFFFTAASKAIIGVINVNGKLTESGVQPDVSISEIHSFKADITSNPVEDGSEISDHIFLKPERVTINAMVSDTPIVFLSGVRRLLDGGARPSQSAFDALQFLFENRQPFSVITGIKQYDDMVFESLEITRNAANAGTLTFTAALVRVFLVRSATTDLPFEEIRNEPDSTANSDRMQSKQDIGDQSTRTATEPEESIFLQFTQSLAGTSFEIAP